MKNAISREIQRKLKRTQACFQQKLKIEILRKQIENSLLRFFLPPLLHAFVLPFVAEIRQLLYLSQLITSIDEIPSINESRASEQRGGKIRAGYSVYSCCFLFGQVGIDLLFSIFHFLRIVPKGSDWGVWLQRMYMPIGS